MSKTIVILGTAHLGTTPGKCSPDGKFREAVWSREICEELKTKLEVYGIETMIDFLPLEPCKEMGNTTNGELSWRVKFVNKVAKEVGKNNVLYVSIHVNAAGSAGKWMSARGWSAYTSPGHTISDLASDFLYTSAEKNLKGYVNFGTWASKQKPIRTDTSDGDKDMEANFYVLRGTSCPAVLTENMFQDNKDDISYLTSDLGKHEIIRTHVEGILWFLENRNL